MSPQRSVEGRCRGKVEHGQGRKELRGCGRLKKDEVVDKPRAGWDLGRYRPPPPLHPLPAAASEISLYYDGVTPFDSRQSQLVAKPPPRARVRVADSHVATRAQNVPPFARVAVLCRTICSKECVELSRACLHILCAAASALFRRPAPTPPACAKCLRNAFPPRSPILRCDTVPLPVVPVSIVPKAAPLGARPASISHTTGPCPCV